ncbi:aminotransferase class I/II-fold pyridoxal phosphate-dependent enzyme [Oceanobacillus saliphilus]|uniref:aminotransferase class I/II-fold pyridoxal phosphate-dependent enzyme n=1 Tax=Oceanobacillus saliphilus TaxID=2925834 RepID=UPI00201E0994|nr:aminotransferase class I/II-fold pyridoxal phosphate-dependent enzyme [Oceanobacillus saliphilus]
MKRNHHRMPLFEKLKQFTAGQPLSFHVPGHKNGTLFPKGAYPYFEQILQLDVTELPGLDDLHTPTASIAEAEYLASDFFGSDHTFFLVGGSTAGNLAMILAVCSAGDKIIVQRNSHKSIINGLELSGAKPVFVAPEYDEELDRYTNPSLSALSEALRKHPDAKAVVLTYPDYFGKTYPIQEMIDLAHAFDIPVLVDEAHGVHFSLGDPFPVSALQLGADVVVQSAHKMAPAMTMASFLHVKSTVIQKERIAHFLQIIQSSSPSYPLMASLDISRSFLATLHAEQVTAILQSVGNVRNALQYAYYGKVLSTDDPLKITFHVEQGISAKAVAGLFEERKIYPELITHNQLLFIHGLAPFEQVEVLKKTIKSVGEQLKYSRNHATIEVAKLFSKPIQELALSYQEMSKLPYKRVSFTEGIGHIAAEAVTPYPPGIPFILKGETITAAHVETIEQLRKQGIGIQQREQGIRIFSI